MSCVIWRKISSALGLVQCLLSLVELCDREQFEQFFVFLFWIWSFDFLGVSKRSILTFFSAINFSRSSTSVITCFSHCSSLPLLIPDGIFAFYTLDLFHVRHRFTCNGSFADDTPVSFWVFSDSSSPYILSGASPASLLQNCLFGNNT